MNKYDLAAFISKIKNNNEIKYNNMHRIELISLF
jgi:hypothetical protein